MPKGKRKAKEPDVFEFLLGFQEFVDRTFLRYTGKTVREHLQDFAQAGRQLPQGEKVSVATEEEMSLDNAYVVMGLPQTASIEEIKRNYRNLARLFHPDYGGYREAMVLLNKAYKRILKEKGLK